MTHYYTYVVNDYLQFSNMLALLVKLEILISLLFQAQKILRQYFCEN